MENSTNKKISRKITILPILFYQKIISPCLPNVCRFTPSCSQYTKEAIICYGVFKGIFFGAMRILRCHPFYKGKLYDPVIDKNGNVFTLATEKTKRNKNK